MASKRNVHDDTKPDIDEEDNTTSTGTDNIEISLNSDFAEDDDAVEFCCSRLCICVTFGCCFVLAAVAIVTWYYAFFIKEDTPDDIAFCGNCHCIVDSEAGDESCPIGERPRFSFREEEILIWQSQIPMNAYELNCNPYQVDDCETEPRMYDYGDDAVCAVHYVYGLEEGGELINGELMDHGNITSNGDDTCKFAYYRLQSYRTWEQAEAAGGFVTHAGACGVCSTMQDLAAYVASTDLTTQGEVCAKQGTISFDLGQKCYQELGMTESCAKLWSYNAWNTAVNCIGSCALDAVSDPPNNGPAPQCELNDCLKCDEEKSGPLFKKFGGRTRRRSGLLSAIVRPCSEIMSRLVQDPCPETTSL